MEKTVLEWMNEYGLMLLNMDERCKGEFTWQRKEQQRVNVNNMSTTW